MRITARRPSAAGYATAADLDLVLDPSPPRPDDCALIHVADFVRERALFTLHTPQAAAAALTSPFFYAGALDHACGILSVPFERLGEQLPPARLRPCFIFSLGRTGSTLLVRLLRAAGCQSVSEPDWFTQLCCLAPQTQRIVGTPMQQFLAEAGVASLATSLGAQPFIKLRSQCNKRPEALLQALTEARAVLMLRRRRAWAESRRRAFGEPPEHIAHILADGLAVADRLADIGHAPHVLWYEDLVADPCAALEGLVPGLAKGQNVAAIMQQDAQADTDLARHLLQRANNDQAFAAAFDRAWREVSRSTALGPRARALAEMLEVG
jgi:LPS sulfotransferase NodH